MMQQYEDAKAACPDALLLFRMGDFYELFHDDAKTAARVIGLTLTSRDKKGENPTPMAGFPHHQLESYLAKLIASGLRVSICDQVEDPKLAKGLVKREITRVVSPGTVTDDALLDPRQNNYLAALHTGKEGVGLAWVQWSTGTFQAMTVAEERVGDELARLNPTECLLAESSSFRSNGQATRAAAATSCAWTVRPDWAFGVKEARKALTQHYGLVNLDGLGFIDADAPAIAAAGALLDYLRETQKTGLEHLSRLAPYRLGSTLEIDESTRRSLEITRTIREGRREGSLLAVLDQSVTAMGSRLLADWVANPSSHLETIVARHDAVEELVGDPGLLEKLRTHLAKVYDVERLLARVSTRRASPRDLSFLGTTLGQLPALKAALAARKSSLLADVENRIDLCADVRAPLEQALVEDCPLTAQDGGFIRPGFHAELDQLRELAKGGKQWIAQYQAREAEATQIPNLKVGFNKVFGYYLEVTHAHRDKVPEHFIRKQTIKNAERYITPDLKEYEEKVLSSDEKAKALEYELFVEMRERVAGELRRLQSTAQALAQADVLAALAYQARSRGYCRPQMTEEPRLDLEDARHPVLDCTLPEGTFVPNDTQAAPDAGLMLLITGPNMAGKSTYIRQVALITLMAQAGSFVPARRAEIGVADRIFARVGASDELAKGLSTFMVEMTETARILNMATPRSLVILDEIGRGTSTYDGVSLAWSIVEHLHNNLHCRTLFATHYHELTELAASLKHGRNLNVAVREWADEVVFLHKIVEGAADKSYGIHVARLAGVPRPVLERAKDVLAELEHEHLGGSGHSRIAHRRPAQATQLSLFAPTEHPLIETIRNIEVERLTPLEALSMLAEWKEQLRSE